MRNSDHHSYMRAALEEAKRAAKRGEVPIGAVLVEKKSGEIVARDGNRTIELNDPSAHAEMLVIRKRCKELGVQRIPDHDLYVTLEPCTMCAAAIAFARIDHLIYGASDEKGGGVEQGAQFFDQPTCHHKIEVTNDVLAEEGGQILKEFFKSKR